MYETSKEGLAKIRQDMLEERRQEESKLERISKRLEELGKDAPCPTNAFGFRVKRSLDEKYF